MPMIRNTLLAVAVIALGVLLAHYAPGAGLAILMAVGFTDVADGSTTSAFRDQQYERLPWAARVAIAIYADTGDTFTVSAFSGNDIMLQNATMPILATGTPIIWPDHFTLRDIAARGEKIGVFAINNTGGVADFRAQAMLDPFAVR